MNISNDLKMAMKEFAGSNYSRSIAYLDTVLQKEPENKLALTTRGACFLRQGDPEKAVADFNRAIAANPDNARAYHLRGIARTEQGDHPGALADFNQAIALDAGYGAAYNSRANLNSMLGRLTAAEKDAAMVSQLTLINIESFANENNLLQTHHFSVEAAMETDLNR